MHKRFDQLIMVMTVFNEGRENSRHWWDLHHFQIRQWKCFWILERI